MSDKTLSGITKDILVMYSEYHLKKTEPILFVETYYQELLDCFEMYGQFLDRIVGSNKFTNEDVALVGSWAIGYRLNFLTRSSNELLNQITKVEPMRAISSDIKIIEKFENLLNDRIIKDLNFNDDLWDFIPKVEKLKNDLKNKEFKLFDRGNYYQKRYISKIEFKDILTMICKKNNLYGVTYDIKLLVDNIPDYSKEICFKDFNQR